MQGRATGVSTMLDRSAGLELQKTAVESLLTNAPELADAWRETLGLLAAGWVVEATNTYQNSRTTSFGPVMCTRSGWN